MLKKLGGFGIIEVEEMAVSSHSVDKIVDKFVAFS